MTALINAIFVVLQLAIIVRVLLSWVDPIPYPNTQFKELLWTVTEPILAPIRRYVPPMGMIDVTPIVAIVLLSVLQQIILTLVSPY